MLDNTLTIDYAGTPINLIRVNQENFSSKYFGENGSQKFNLSVAHTVPQRGLPGESHLVRLDVEHYDAEGVYIRTSSAWTVIKTFDGVQDSTASENTLASLGGLVTDVSLPGKIIARES